VTHKVFKGEALAIEAFETRVLVGRHPENPARLKSAPVRRRLLRSSCGAEATDAPPKEGLNCQSSFGPD